MYCTLKYYRSFIILFSLEPLLFLAWFLLDPDTDVGVHIAVAFAVLLFGILPLTYNIYFFVTLRRRCREYTPECGTVIDWEPKTARGSNRLVIRQGDRIIHSQPNFSYFRARRCVDREIEFADLDGYIFIYRILEKELEKEDEGEE